MKKLKKDLEAISKALNGLAQKVQKLQEQIGEQTEPTKKPKPKAVKAKAVKKTAVKKVAAKKAAPKKAASKKVAPATAADTPLYNYQKIKERFWYRSTYGKDRLQSKEDCKSGFQIEETGQDQECE